VAPSAEADSADPTESQLTQAGAVLGTAHYISPEQLRSQPVDERADLFSAGTLVFEMLTGRYAFAGSTVLEVYHATLYEQPPALGGSPAIAALDRVVRRALSKPEDRYPSAASMAEDLRAALLLATRSSPRVTAITRLIVLPSGSSGPTPTRTSSSASGRHHGLALRPGLARRAVQRARIAIRRGGTASGASRRRRTWTSC
jgi:serine/threonine-protein kinase